jgi:hypothetical protein
VFIISGLPGILFSFVILFTIRQPKKPDEAKPNDAETQKKEKIETNLG